MPYCAVRWCGINNMTEEFRKFNITFHRFPRIPRIKYAWVQAIRLRKEGWFPSYSSVICSRHFKNECFVPHKNRRRLRETAVPTEYLITSMQNYNIERFRENDERQKKEILFRSRLIPITEKCEGEQIIKNVYHYLETQYITLRTYLPDVYDLSSMADILARTSDATGVRKETISDIFKNEKMLKRREKFLMKQVKMEKFMRELQLDRNYQIVEKFQNSVIQHAGPAIKTTPNNPQPCQSLPKATVAKKTRAKKTPKATTAKLITSVSANVTAAKTAVAKQALAKTIITKRNAAKTIPFQTTAAKTVPAKTKSAKRQVWKIPKCVDYKEARIAPKPPPRTTLLPNYSPISSDDEGVTNMDCDQPVNKKRCTSILHHTSDAKLNDKNKNPIQLLVWTNSQQEHKEEPSGTVFGFSSDAEVENITVEPDIGELCLQEEPIYGEAAEENIPYTCDVQIQIQEAIEPEYLALYDYRIPSAVVSDPTLPTPDVAIRRESTDNKIENNITPTYVQSLKKNTVDATRPNEIKTEPKNNLIEPNITTRNNQTVITHTNTLYNTGMKTEPENHVIEPNIISNIHSVTDTAPTTPKVEMNTETERNEMQSVKLIINNKVWGPPDLAVFKYEPRSEFSDYYRNFV